MGVPTGCTLESEKYQVIRELGRGGMGVVYLAEDRQLKRQVALKVLYEHLNRNSVFVERFREEARSVSTLHHPHIVCVHGLERSGETVAIDMEYVQGQSLDHFRQTSQLNAHVVAGIAADVLSGLATCHEIGVVHRDIKPSNILIGEDGRAKITDFGLATAYASHLETTIQGNTSSGFYMGTPRYMPIKAWEGGRAEPCWDLYAFGVVLYELLSGRSAFDGDNPVAIMRQQLAEPLPRVEDITAGVSPEFSGLVSRLLATGDKAAGHTTTRDVLGDLLETPEFKALHASNHSMTLALPPPRRRPVVALPRPMRPSKWALAAVLVGGLLLAGMLALYTNRQETTREPRPPATVAQDANAIRPTTKSGADVRDAANNLPFQSMDVIAVNDDRFGRAVWMLEQDQQGSTVRIIGFTPLEVWWLDVSPAVPGGPQRIDGFWAASLNADNTSVHLGTLSGSLLRDVSTGHLVAHVVRTRTRDDTRSELSLTARPRSDGLDRIQFLRLLEKNAPLQSLLYRELLPRRLPWATALEAMLPSLPGGRTSIPYSEAEIVVDGTLDELVWTQPVYNASGRIGELVPQTGPENARLWIRWSEEAVYLSARVPNAGNELRFELGVMAAVDTSSTSGGRFFASLDERGRLESRYVQGGHEKPWSCDWNGEIQREGDEASVEFRIGLSGLAEKAHPADGRRWRLNARLTSAAENGRRVLADWGDSELTMVEHGALLVFEHRR